MADSARKLAVQILRDGRTLDVDRAAKLIAEHDAEIHQFYQSGEAWTKHEAALAEHIDKLLAEARREMWDAANKVAVDLKMALDANLIIGGPNYRGVARMDLERLRALLDAPRDSGKAEESSICPRCMGSGVYKRLPHVDGKPCAICNGTGEIADSGKAAAQPTGTPEERER